MTDIPVDQALYHRPEQGPPLLLARSSGFQDDWQPEAERLIHGFGERPAGTACPDAIFAQPFGKDRIAVVQVADQGSAGVLGFFFTIVPRTTYEKYIGDPFIVAERWPADWQARHTLADVSWPAQPLPARTVGDVQRVLRRVKAAALREDEEADTAEQTLENAESPALLGGVQILVDGGRVVFLRPGPDTALLKGLWTLLPTSTRCHLWPASFAFGNALGFDALVVPPGPAAQLEGYYQEEQAADYPAGHYELALQTAAEAGDQAELDALFGRRSTSETFRLALTLIVLLVGLIIASRFLGPAPPLTTAQVHKAAAAAGMIGAADPWTALAIKLHGDNLWLPNKKP